MSVFRRPALPAQRLYSQVSWLALHRIRGLNDSVSKKTVHPTLERCNPVASLAHSSQLDSPRLIVVDPARAGCRVLHSSWPAGRTMARACSSLTSGAGPLEGIVYTGVEPLAARSRRVASCELRAAPRRRALLWSRPAGEANRLLHRRNEAPGAVAPGLPPRGPVQVASVTP